MTVLRLQNLQIPDCEDIVEQGFYEWGRGYPADALEPPWQEASLDRKRIIVSRGYALYEGLPVQRGNDIGLMEIYFSVGVNSYVILYDAVRFLTLTDAARPLLARIPDGVALEEGTDEQIDAAAQLIDLFSTASHIDRGKATKVLYKKRPEFIPVIDSIVSHFLWKNFPHLLTQQSSNRDVLRLFRHILMAQIRPLSQVKSSLKEKGLSLSTGRLLSYLIWLEWRKRDAEAIRTLWGTDILKEAKMKAQQMWEQQRSEE